MKKFLEPIFKQRWVILLPVLMALAFVSSNSSQGVKATNEGCSRGVAKVSSAPGRRYDPAAATSNWEDSDYYYTAYNIGVGGDATQGNGAYFRTNNGLPCSGTFDPGVGSNNDYVTFNDQRSFYLHDDGNSVKSLPDQIAIGLPNTRLWDDNQPCGPPISQQLTPPLVSCQGGLTVAGNNASRAAGLTDDSGRLVIDSGGTTTTLWCVGLESGLYFTPATPAGWQSCPPDISNPKVQNSPAGYHAGAGYLVNGDGCVNYESANAIINAFVTSQCTTSGMLRWYRAFLPSKFISQYIRQNNDNSLHDVGFHYDSKNSHAGGWGVYTVLTYRYPKNDATCSVDFRGATLSPGGTYPATVTMINSGQRPWIKNQAYQPADFFLKETNGVPLWPITQDAAATPSNAVNDPQYGNNTVSLPTNGPFFNGSKVTFNFKIQVPISGGTLKLRMAQGSSSAANLFGDTGCDTTINTSTNFTLNPHTSVSTDDEENNVSENPFTARVVNSYVDEANGKTVKASSGNPITVNRKLYYQINSTGAQIDIGGSPYPADNIPNVQYNLSDLPPENTQSLGLKAGDRICASITVSPATGTMDSSGNITDGSGTTPPVTDCIPIVDKPYAKVFNSDVIVGGAFEPTTSCSNTAGISTFYDHRASRTPAGAGVQFAAYVMGQITKFPTGNFSGSNISPAFGLSFANSIGAGPMGQVNPPDFLGGGFGGTNCVPDYFDAFSSYSSTTYDQCNTAAPFLNISSNNLNSRGFMLYSPITDNGAGACPNNLQRIRQPIGERFKDGMHGFIMIDGDAYITASADGNPGIVYANETWSKDSDIPLFYLIVSGNLYIDQSVSRLDGIYIAQPRSDGSGGTIYTCTGLVGPGAGTVDTFSGGNLKTNFIDNNCHNNSLTVNGTFIAQNIKLDRTINSLRNDPSGAGNSTFNTSDNGSSAAETFALSPEIYMANICSDPTSPVSIICKATSSLPDVTGLPPVL